MWRPLSTSDESRNKLVSFLHNALQLKEALAWALHSLLEYPLKASSGVASRASSLAF